MLIALKIAILEKFGPGRQYVVAQRTGLSESTFSRILLGRRPATQAERRAIAKVLGRSIGDLFPEEES